MTLYIIISKKQPQEVCNFINKETLAQVFSCEFCEISKNTFFTEHLWATASVSNRRLLNISFSLVKSNYSPVFWMLHSRFLYYKLNKLCQLCLHGIHNDRKSNFGQLLENDSYISIYKYACSMYEVINGS